MRTQKAAFRDIKTTSPELFIENIAVCFRNSWNRGMNLNVSPYITRGIKATIPSSDSYIAHSSRILISRN